MKTKMIPFIFMIVSILSTVHCSSDAKEFDSPYRPESPLLIPEDENNLIVPQIEEPPTNSSSSESESESPQYHMERIRQDLIGIYEGTEDTVNQQTRFHITSHTAVHRMMNGVETFGTYTVDFSGEDIILVSFHIEGITYEYYIHLSLNNDHVIGFDSSPIPNLSSFFHKVRHDANEIPYHDEL